VKAGAFDFDLPPELIASHPPERREDSRMLLVDRATGQIGHASVRDFPELLKPDDLVVLNDTRVTPARFFGNGGKTEILRTQVTGPNRWQCMVRPGRKFRVGATVHIGESHGTVIQVLDDGQRIIQFDQEPDSEAHGHLALPPYLGREEEPLDRERYQTVFARREGAIAAPTAGLHLTPEMLAQMPHTFVTLHVGAGTFLPVKVEEIEAHRLHEESYRIGETAAEAISCAASIVAVGTTVVRVLEACALGDGTVRAGQGATRLFIHEPFSFRVVDALLTNFHLPRSTLLMLVCAFAGRELVLEAYAKAVEARYRFYSYGDCMWIR
jgi:S-adenosylmethionine:tRNA ribosyltransferase-isomerase